MGNGNFSTESSLGEDDIPNLLEWDKEKKGNIIELSNNRKTFSTGTNYISWNCILSKNVFTTGVNYVEAYINKIGEGFLFYGIGTNSNIPYNECIGGSQSCLIAGYDARFVQSSHPSVVKHTITDSIPKFSEPQRVGLIIDMEKKELSYIIKGNRILAYSNIPPSVHVFACAAHNVDITFTKHIKGEKKIQNYLNKSDKLNCELNNFNSLLEWDITKKGPIFSLTDSNRTFTTGQNYIAWNCILSKNSITSGAHYVEASIDTSGLGFLFYGIATPENIPYGECIGGAQSCLVAGYDARFVERCHPGVVKHQIVDLIPKFTQTQVVGLYVDMDRKEFSYVIQGKKLLAYSNIPSPVHVFACSAHAVTVSLTKYIVGRQKAEDYLDQMEMQIKYLRGKMNENEGANSAHCSLLEWDSNNKGPIFQLSNLDKTISTGPNYVSWNCILSKNNVSSGVHYIEAQLEKSGGGFLFFGIATTDNIPLYECIGGAQSCLVVGYDARFLQSSHPNVVKLPIADTIPKFTQPQAIGMLIDLDKKELSFVISGNLYLCYVNIPSNVHVFACAAHDITLTLTKHIVGRDEIAKMFN